MSRAETFAIAPPPHLHGQRSTEQIMRHVTLAAAPLGLFAIYVHGLSALLVLAVAVSSCLLTEYLLCRLQDLPSTLDDGSAAVTGVLYGLSLPPGLPLWMAAVGGVVAIALGKALFGGLGYNPFNPALVGRVVLQAAFPVAMTTWSAPLAADRFNSLASATLTPPFMQPTADAYTGATPLAAFKFAGQATDAADLALGLVGGSTGEASAILVLAGGAYLAGRGMLNWRIPAAILLCVAALSAIFHTVDPTAYPGPLFMLTAGGLCFGAVFMATDMVTAPLTHVGAAAYGILIGVLVVAIRLWGGLPEGVQYSILFANGCVPLIDRAIRPRVYGTGNREPKP
jgi:Na+-translocating ferredoxin:NAD+ oxidoreductase subunit D